VTSSTCRPPHTLLVTTTMLATSLLLLMLHASLGLNIKEDHDKLEENLQKVLDDTIQNTELDGDNLLDFPAWTADSHSDEEDQESGEKTGEEAPDKNNDGINQISDLIKNYLTQHFNKRKENTPNRWSFWKDFVTPHQNNLWSDHHHSQSLGLGHPWTNLRNIFRPTPPPRTNWWTEIFSSNSRIDSPASPDSMFTFYHKMTVNNKTKEGVAKVPSSQLMPFMRTVWNNLSPDSHMALGLGALLPFLGLLLPLIVFAFIVPIVLLVMVSVFGIMSGALVLMPLLLTGLLGQNGLPVDRMIEELFLNEFDGEEFWTKQLEDITENYQTEGVTEKAVEEVEEIPRFLSF